MKTFTKYHSQTVGEFWKTKFFSNQTKNIEVGQKVIEEQITDKIYYGCAAWYSNGERELIDFEKGEKCLIPTSNPFWLKEIPTDCRLQMRSSTKKR